MRWMEVLRSFYFYPRPPRGGRPVDRRQVLLDYRHFYPRPPRGGRRGQTASITRLPPFLPTPSARRATGVSVCTF